MKDPQQGKGMGEEGKGNEMGKRKGKERAMKKGKESAMKKGKEKSGMQGCITFLSPLSPPYPGY